MEEKEEKKTMRQRMEVGKQEGAGLARPQPNIPLACPPTHTHTYARTVLVLVAGAPGLAGHLLHLGAQAAHLDPLLRHGRIPQDGHHHRQRLRVRVACEELPQLRVPRRLARRLPDTGAAVRALPRRGRAQGRRPVALAQEVAQVGMVVARVGRTLWRGGALSWATWD